MAILNESTDKIQSPAKPWQFKPGQSGNPNGRPKGSRNKKTLAALPLTADDLVRLNDMEKPALIAIIKRVSAANWGLFVKTDNEIYQMMLDKLRIFAFTSKNIGTMLKAMDMYLNRTIGKPARAVNTTSQKVGVLEILEEMDKKRRKQPAIDITPPVF
jgi:hypothetical protein